MDVFFIILVGNDVCFATSFFANKASTVEEGDCHIADPVNVEFGVDDGGDFKIKRAVVGISILQGECKEAVVDVRGEQLDGHTSWRDW